MKKKLLAIYALTGALVAGPVFTSCIDSEESPTVTAIRNANAEKQTALAALAQAQAEAETILAKAQAALYEAQAQAQLAQAKKAEAEAAMQEIKNEAERIALEKAKKQAEYDLAKIQADIEKQALEVETALLNAQKNLLIAQESLKSTIEMYEENKVAELEELTNAYTDKLSQLLEAKKTLSHLNVQLIQAQADLVDAQTSLEKTIMEKNNQIALNNVKIEAYKASTNYTEDLEALKTEYATLQIQNNDAFNKKITAEDKYNNTNPDISVEAVSEAAKAILEDDFYRLANGGWWDEENQEWISAYPASNYILNKTSFQTYGVSSNDYNWIEIYNANNNGYKETEYTYKDNYKTTIGHELSFTYEADDLAKLEIEVANLIASNETNIKAWETSLEAEETALKDAQTAESAAKKAWEEATDADKSAKETTYQAAIQTRIDAENNVANYTEQIEEAEENVANYKYWLDVFKKGDTELQEKITAYNEAVKTECEEKVTAWQEKIDAEIAYNEINAKYTVLDNMLYDYNGWTNGATNIANEIKSLEEQNEEFAKDIEEAKLLLSNHYNNGAACTQEALIEYYEGQIAVQETKIATLEIAVAAAKAELDAAMPEEEAE